MSDQREMTRAEIDALRSEASEKAARMPQVRDRLTRLEKAVDVASSLPSRVEDRLAGYLSPDTTTDAVPHLGTSNEVEPRRVTAPVADQIEDACRTLETMLARFERLFDRLEA